MRSSVGVAFAVVLLFACNVKQPPYIKHKLVTFAKLARDCGANELTFKMESTIIGERYEFQKCLGERYDGRYTAERKGDTVELRFAATDGPKVLYKLTMDVDAFPHYHFLTIDGTTFAVVPAQN